MWRLIEALLVRQLTGSFRVAVEESVDRFRRLGSALVIAQAGVIFGAFGIGFILLSLFFYLSSETTYVRPALVAGLTGLIPTLVCLIAAGRLSRR